MRRRPSVESIFVGADRSLWLSALSADTEAAHLTAGRAATPFLAPPFPEGRQPQPSHARLPASIAAAPRAVSAAVAEWAQPRDRDRDLAVVAEGNVQLDQRARAREAVTMASQETLCVL